VDQLPETERTVIGLYYVENLTLKEIGAVLNVSESRVSQLHTRALLRLKGAITRTDDGFMEE
jgi:RNA polymerase sigma factor FliA